MEGNCGDHVQIKVDEPSYANDKSNTDNEPKYDAEQGQEKKPLDTTGIEQCSQVKMKRSMSDNFDTDAGEMDKRTKDYMDKLSAQFDIKLN